MGNTHASVSDSNSDTSDDLWPEIAETVYNTLSLNQRETINVLVGNSNNSRHGLRDLAFDIEMRQRKVPLPFEKSDLTGLKNSSIYEQLKESSGVPANINPDDKVPIMQMLQKRQLGSGGRGGGFTNAECCRMNNLYLPNASKRLDQYTTKFFCGTLSKDGNNYVTTSQDHVIRVYDTSKTEYKTVNKILAKDVSWCILDIDFSPVSDQFVYSTWSPFLNIVSMNGSSEDIRSLNLRPLHARFCVFSVAFSNSGNEIVCGANNGCLYIYDRTVQDRTLEVQVQDPSYDMNAVGFADNTSNIFYSGCDNGLIQVWDRRCLSEAHPEPVGVLNGHHDGITYIDSKNDGRYLISNSKDQSIKLWDIRVFSPTSNSSSSEKPKYNWDYRWDDIPRDYRSEPPRKTDTSVITFRGHCVAKSLIRAKFSPAASTGQRYIYTGCASGRLIIYDILTGDRVRCIDGHTNIVRDVAWHPRRNEIFTVSWDGRVNVNYFKKYFNRDMPIKRPRHHLQDPQHSDD